MCSTALLRRSPRKVRAKMDARDRRLRADAQKVQDLAENSDLIEVRALELLPGQPPEVWEVTYRCRGIVGTHPDGSPVFGDHHCVRIELSRDYPEVPPIFEWQTPIVHPNIEGHAPHRVCINQARWQPGHYLDTIVLMIGEMVQYKNYHSQETPPWPLDRDAAAWARSAERAGYFSPTSPVDPRPLLRPDHRAPGAEAPRAGTRIRVRTAASSPATTSPRPSRVRAIRTGS